MSTKPKYYIVESSALPEVFLKVAEAKRLLSTGEASTVNEATRMTDISRSAFYKYRDAVLPFQSMMTGRIITFQLLLHDEQGLLSEILGVFADAGANISTTRISLLMAMNILRRFSICACSEEEKFARVSFVTPSTSSATVGPKIFSMSSWEASVSSMQSDRKSVV